MARVLASLTKRVGFWLFLAFFGQICLEIKRNEEILGILGLGGLVRRVWLNSSKNFARKTSKTTELLVDFHIPIDPPFLVHFLIFSYYFCLLHLVFSPFGVWVSESGECAWYFVYIGGCVCMSGAWFSLLCLSFLCISVGKSVEGVVIMYQKEKNRDDDVCLCVYSVSVCTVSISPCSMMCMWSMYYVVHEPCVELCRARDYYV